MYRPIVSNPLHLDPIIDTLRHHAECDRHRAVMVLECPADGWLKAFAADRHAPFVPARHTSDRADRITGILGQEFDTLVHETSERPDAGLLAALAGTVRAGGVLLLGVPFRLAESRVESSPGRFNRRFCRLLLDLHQRYPDKVQLLAAGLQDANLHDTPCTTSATAEYDSLPARLATSPARSVHDSTGSCQAQAVRPANPSAEVEQNALLERACRHLLDHTRGSISITGRRGRGKSALLGRLADWLLHRQVPVTVTANRQSALHSVNRHCGHIVRFRAPEEACRSGAGVLLVDEASSLPIDTLIGFMDHHDHVIYCTTVEGYENAGRAFEIRFQQSLLRQEDPCLALTPVIPWRWAGEDPLESLTDTLLLTHAGQIMYQADEDSPEPDPTAAVESAHVAAEQFPARRLDRAELADDERLLREVFGLLRDTHYQTSATDLAHLLDGPGVQVWVLQHEGHIRAALLLTCEGSLQENLHEAIVSKQRRLPHQLLPQLLAQCANDPQVLGRHFARIIRIAVASDVRRQGLGTRLLRHVESKLTAPHGTVTALGASFASDAASRSFWQKNGYVRFHTGFRHNPRTGRQAVAVIKCFDTAVARVAERAIAIHDDNHRCRQGLQGLPDTSDHDASLLRRFARGERSVHDTYAALSRLGHDHDLPLKPDENMSRRRYENALRAVVSELIRESGSAGDLHGTVRQDDNRS